MTYSPATIGSFPRRWYPGMIVECTSNIANTASPNQSYYQQDNMGTACYPHSVVQEHIKQSPPQPKHYDRDIVQQIKNGLSFVSGELSNPIGEKSSTEETVLHAPDLAVFG